METGYQRRIGVREENAAAALEVMSRFAIDPRWLVYLPPTMSPVATSTRPDLLEHPDQAFDGTGPRASTRSCARRSTWARARWRSSAGPRAARARFGAPGTRRRGVDPHRTVVLRPPSTAELIDRLRRRRTAELFDDWHRLAVARRRADALVRQGRECCATSTPPSAPPPAPRSRPRSTRSAGRPGRAGRGRPAGAHPAREANAAPSPPPTGVTAGRSTAWTAYGWPRSSCWPGEATLHATRHAWHLDLPTGWSPPTRIFIATRRRFVEHDRPSGGNGDRRLVGPAHRAGGEGMVVKPPQTDQRGRDSSSRE